MKYVINFVLLMVTFAMIGCSSIADPVPSSPAPVTNVEDYYLPLKNIGTSYAYCRKSTAGADTLLMTMQGNDPAGTSIGGHSCYSTDLTKTNIYLDNYYYAMNDSEAYILGVVSCGGTDKLWLDLKAPLNLGQTWKFNSNGSSFPYTATVTRRGVQMKMPDGSLYNDVAEVVYTSQSDTTIKWFAKGVGLIYSSSNTADSDFGKEMWFIGQR